jgi:hypothetical protein
MTAPSKRLELERALQALPETLIGEIIFGELVTQPRPAVRHAQAASATGEALGPPFNRGRNGPGGWIILFEPEITFGPHVLVPDLAGWRRENLGELPDIAAPGTTRACSKATPKRASRLSKRFRSPHRGSGRAELLRLF